MPNKKPAFPAARVKDPISVGASIIVGGENTVLIGSAPKPIACKDCKARELLSQGNPVNVQLGCKFESERVDFALPAPLPLVWQPFYASDTPFTGLLGQGWRIPVELSVDADERATRLIDIQGRWIDFAPLALGEEQHCPSEGIWLARGTTDTSIPWDERWQWLPETFRHDPHLIIATPGDGDYLIFEAVVKPVPSKENPQPIAAGRFYLSVMLSRHGYRTRLRWRSMHNAAGQPVRVPEFITDSAERIYRLHCSALPDEHKRLWSSGHPDSHPDDDGIRLSGISLAYDPLRDARAPADLAALRDLRVTEWLVRYRYSEAGDLIEVQDGDGDSVVEYEYEQHLMTRKRTPDGRDVSYQYDRHQPDGKVIRQSQAGGLDYVFVYGEHATSVTDSLGRKTTYHFAGEAGLRRLVKLENADGGSIAIDYTRDGQMSEFIDPLGRKTTYRHTSLGEYLGSFSPLGQRTERYLDHATGFVTSASNAEGVSTYFTRDARGNVVETRSSKFAGAKGGATRYEYEHSQFPDRPTAIVDARGGRKLLTYDSLAQLRSYTDCSGHTTTWQRDRKGQLIAIDSADGKRQSYRRDQKGRIIAVELPEGRSEAFEYDQAGRLVKAIDAQGRPVAFRYDRFDRIVEHRTWSGEGTPKGDDGDDGDNSAGWSCTRYGYDLAGRLERITDPAGAAISFSYDAMDRLIAENGFDGKRSRYQYNLAGEMMQQIDAAGTPAALAIVHERDAGGRLIARHLPQCDGHPADTHRFEYNKLNQLVFAATACSRTDFLYDDFNRLAAETQSADDGSSFTVHYGYDLLGNRIQTVLPDGQTIDVLMSGGGHWHQVAFNSHALVDVERDSLYRETSRSFGSGAHLAVEHPLTRHQTYTGAGQLGSVAFSRGGLISEQWRHQYDPTGLMTRIDQELANLRKTIRYAYDAQQRLSAWDVHEAARPASSGPHAPAPTFERVHGAEYAHDKAGNPIMPGTVIRIDPVSNMPVYIAPEQWAEQVKANVDNPDFNLLGMRPSRANRIAQLGQAFHEHDERGNVIKRRTPEGSWVFSWNALNQMSGSRYTPAGSTTAIFDATYFNDAFGRRIAKNVIDLRTLVERADGAIDFDQTRHSPVRFVWDGDRVLQEIHIDHAKTIVYEPGTFIPLAQIIQPKRAEEPLVRACGSTGEFQMRWMAQRNLSMMLANQDLPEAAKRQLRAQLGQDSPYVNEDVQIHLFVTDHLGTPFRMIDAATHKPLWERQQDPYGNTLSERWHPKLDGLYRPTLRFQGQQHDWETGLFYNRYRYYDPLMRRYMAQDPIGINGGLNFYGYVKGNPVGYADPLGLVDIYVGGAGDSSTGIVKNYVKNNAPNAKYFEWTQRKDVQDFIEKQPDGEPINLIGHSYGGDTAAWAALDSCKPSSCKTITSLTTIDPVSRGKPDYKKLKERVGTWTNINATPSASDRTDTIAAIGGKWGEGPRGTATTFSSVNANHGNFPGMMDTIPDACGP